MNYHASSMAEIQEQIQQQIYAITEGKDEIQPGGKE
jgi:hypothetical protein